MDFEQVGALIEKAGKISVIVHTRPDGDAIGSGLALQMALEKHGKDVSLISPDPLAGFLQWLPQAGRILIFSEHPDKSERILRESDLIFIVDFNTFSRAGNELGAILEQLVREKTFLMIDHHLQPDERIPYRLSDPSKASSAELVFEFLQKTGLIQRPDPEIATAVYTGILTDTGSFKFDKTSGQTHRIAAQLIEAGADNAAIHSRIFDTYSYQRLQLLGEAIRRMKVIPDCGVSYIVLDEETLRRFQYKPGDTEGIVNYGLMLDGIRFTALITQKPDENKIRLSFRSKGNFDVNRFARAYFDGGGHKNAAGGSFKGSLDELESYLLDKVRQHCDEIKQA